MNFVAVINPHAIHLVVDDVPTGGVPDHQYLDRRKEQPVLPLDALVGSSVRELSFRQPLGVSLPLAAFVDDEAQRRTVLRPVASAVIEQLASEHSCGASAFHLVTSTSRIHACIPS